VLLAADSFNLPAATALWADCGLIPVSCVRRSSSLPRALSMSHQPPRIMDAAAGRMDDLAELRIERIVRP